MSFEARGGTEKEEEEKEEEKEEKIPHMCESIGHRPLREKECIESHAGESAIYLGPQSVKHCYLCFFFAHNDFC